MTYYEDEEGDTNRMTAVFILSNKMTGMGDLNDNNANVKILQ